MYTPSHTGFLVTIEITPVHYAFPYPLRLQELVIGSGMTRAEDVEEVAVNCVTGGKVELTAFTKDNLVHYADNPVLADANIFLVRRVTRLDPGVMRQLTSYMQPHSYQDLLDMGQPPYPAD